MSGIRLVGFDADDTLWHSEIHFQHAHAQFELILSAYVDLADARLHERLLETERRNLKLFGYGAKGMALSMVESAIDITQACISASDIHRLIELGKAILQHPVELLPGIREAVEAVAARWPLVLITKGDLFHQEAKVAQSALAHLFQRIEIVSEKDANSYRRVLAECGTAAEDFVMIGNSLRSDIEPVIRLGGWGVHMPYAVTWALEAEHGLATDEVRFLSVREAREIAHALDSIERLAQVSQLQR